MIRKKIISWATLVVIMLAFCVGTVVIPSTHIASAAVAIDPYEWELVGATTDETQIPEYLKGNSVWQAGVQTKFRDAYKAMMDSGFDMGYIAADGNNYGIRDWMGWAIQEFRGGDHTQEIFSRVHGILIMGQYAANMKAAALVNEIYKVWHKQTSTYGYPYENQFELGDKIYQNFSNGYISFDKLNGQSAFKANKRMLSDGTESDILRPELETGFYDGYEPYWVEDYKEEIKAIFQQAEHEIKTTDLIKQGGYDLGSASGFLELWRPEDVIITQKFEGGESRGNPYGWGNQARLVMNDGRGKAFLLSDGFLKLWADNGGVKGAGYPLDNPFYYSDSDGQKRIQVFSNCVMVMDNIGFVESQDLTVGKFGYSDIISSARKNLIPLVTAGIFNAFKRNGNYGQNIGYPIDYVKYSEGVYYQVFAGGSNTAATDYKAQIISNPNGYSHVVSGQSLSIFMREGGIKFFGYPLTDVLAIEGKQYQNFQKGYINITDNTYTRNKYISTDGTEIGLDTIPVHNLIGVTEGLSSEYDSIKIKEAFVNCVIRLAQNGYNIGIPSNYAYISIDNPDIIVQEFVGGESLANYKRKSGITMLYVNVKDFYRTNISKDSFYIKSIEQGAGAPISEEFGFSNGVYQNYTTGSFYKNVFHDITYRDKISVNINGQFFDVRDGSLSDGVPDYVGVLGSVTNMTSQYRNNVELVRQKFRNEYARLLSIGFYPGVTDTEFVHTWTTGTFDWINQTFYNGDSTSTIYGNYHAMKIFLMDIDSDAYSIYSDMMTAWVYLGGLGEVGYPYGNQFEVDGYIYQNFYSGYIKMPVGNPGQATFVYGEQKKMSDKTSAERPGSNNGLIEGVIIGGVVLAVGIGLIVLYYLVVKKRLFGHESKFNLE